MARSFDVFFDLRLNKRLSKQSRHRWLETPSRSLWRHCNHEAGWNWTQHHRLMEVINGMMSYKHDDVIKWKHFPRNWPFVREIHRSPVNFPHKGQWRGALMFSLINAWINDWLNNREAGDLRRQHGHYDVIVMVTNFTMSRVALSTTGWMWCVMVKEWFKRAAAKSTSPCACEKRITLTH